MAESITGAVAVQVPEHRVEQASRDLIRRGLQPFCLALGAYYGFLTVFHGVFGGPAVALPLALATLSSSLLFFAASILLGARPVPRDSEYAAVIAMSFVVLANITFYQVLSGEPRNFVNYALVNVIAGVLLHNRFVVIGILAVDAAAWFLAVSLTDTGDPVFDGTFLAGTWVLALGLSHTRRRAIEQQEGLRIAAEIALDQAERRLEQRDRAILAHQRSQEGLRLLIEFCRDGVLIVQFGTVVYANRAFRDHLGLHRDAIFDHPLAERVSPEDVDFADESFLKQEARTGVEVRFLDSAGHPHTYEVTSSRVEYGDGPAILLLCSDSTSLDGLGRDDLAHRMLAVGTLAAGVAHEINNPLAYTMANLEMLQIELSEGQAGDPRHLELVSTALEGTLRVSHIVADLRAMSRRDEDSIIAVDVEELLEGAIRIAWNEVRHRAQVVRDYGSPPPVMATPSRLGQVFLNLLVNAAQAIEDGDVTGQEIRVRTLADGDETVIEIRDTGTGMGEAMLEQIFRPFFTTKPVGMGTGLGLPYCRDTVEELGGRIEVESVPGVGSTFRVRLPSTSLSATPMPTEAPGPQRAPGRRILVIDDEAPLGAAIAAVLGTDRVEVVCTGHEALELLEDGDWDAILCDIMMPDLPGSEVFRLAVERRPELANRFAFITGGTFTQAGRDLIECTPRPVLAKPFRAERLRALIDEIAAQRSR